MEYLRNHADRAIARHMLSLAALVIAVAFAGYVGSEFLAAANSLGETLGSIEVGK